MKSQSKIPLVGSDGQPLPERIQRTLKDLLPRFHRWFPLVHDEAVVTELLEETGQRIREQERKSGPIERLHGFAWTVLRNLAASELRHSRSKIQLKSTGSEHGYMLMSRMSADRYGAVELETRLALDQALQQVSDMERKVAILKAAQFTSAEIAAHLRTTVGAIDQTYFRVKHKLRKLLGPHKEC